jgi:alpha-L-fucosidase
MAINLNRRDLLKGAAAVSAGSLLAPEAVALDQDRTRTASGSGPFRPSWNSLRNITVPQWLRDGKFGIYTHWGIYAVPAYSRNATWYAYHVYTNPDSDERKHHEATYGPLEKFGYKDFIPMFTASRFDPDEWAELFKNAGARFAGPVAEHPRGMLRRWVRDAMLLANSQGPSNNMA